MRFLRIGILYPGGGEHDASAIPAMDESETVAELMNGRLLHTGQKQVVIGRLVVIPGIKSPGRNNRALAGHFSRPENKGEDGDIEIHLGHPYNFKGSPGTTCRQTLQNTFGAILPACLIIGIIWVRHTRQHTHGHFRPCFNTFRDTTEDILVNGTDGTDKDTFRHNGSGFPPFYSVLIHFVIEGLAVDIQLPGGFADIPIRLFQYPQYMRPFHHFKGFRGIRNARIIVEKGEIVGQDLPPPLRSPGRVQ